MNDRNRMAKRYVQFLAILFVGIPIILLIRNPRDLSPLVIVVVYVLVLLSYQLTK
jgi:hypothetical protein